MVVGAIEYNFDVRFGYSGSVAQQWKRNTRSKLVVQVAIAVVDGSN